MPFEERRERWHAMMKDIIARDVNWWSRSFVAALTKS
jgi:trehalose-6-phosphate synthase